MNRDDASRVIAFRPVTAADLRAADEEATRYTAIMADRLKNFADALRGRLHQADRGELEEMLVALSIAARLVQTTRDENDRGDDNLVHRALARFEELSKPSAVAEVFKLETWLAPRAEAAWRRLEVLVARTACDTTGRPVFPTVKAFIRLNTAIRRLFATQFLHAQCARASEPASTPARAPAVEELCR